MSDSYATDAVLAHVVSDASVCDEFKCLVRGKTSDDYIESLNTTPLTQALKNRMLDAAASIAAFLKRREEQSNSIDIVNTIYGAYNCVVGMRYVEGLQLLLRESIPPTRILASLIEAKWPEGLAVALKVTSPRPIPWVPPEYMSLSMFSEFGGSTSAIALAVAGRCPAVVELVVKDWRCFAEGEKHDYASMLALNARNWQRLTRSGAFARCCWCDKEEEVENMDMISCILKKQMV